MYSYGCICHINNNKVYNESYDEPDCRKYHFSPNSIFNVVPYKGFNRFESHDYYFNSLYVENNCTLDNRED